MALKKSKMMLQDGFPMLPDFESMETGEATKQDIYDTQGMIAYVQKTLKADKAYTAGDSFIYNGNLYTVTASIAKDATIVLEGTGANAELAESIQGQIEEALLYRPKLSDTDWITPVINDNRLTIVKGGYKVINGRVFVNVLASVDFAITAQGYNSISNFYDVLRELPLPYAGICEIHNVNYMTYDSEHDRYNGFSVGRCALYKASSEVEAIISIASSAAIVTTDSVFINIKLDYDIETT